MANNLITFISLCNNLFALLLLARIIMSFIQVDRYHPVAKLIFDLTEPFLAPIRSILPPAGMFDFSPMVALLIAQVVSLLLKQLVQSLF